MQNIIVPSGVSSKENQYEERLILLLTYVCQSDLSPTPRGIVGSPKAKRQRRGKKLCTMKPALMTAKQVAVVSHRFFAGLVQAENKLIIMHRALATCVACALNEVWPASSKQQPEHLRQHHRINLSASSCPHLHPPGAQSCMAQSIW